jgi:CoA:oxalate CoA-transferase
MNKCSKTRRTLEGLRVLDLTRVLAGPYCTMLLADMGAEVIKLEIPERGDDTRTFWPVVNGRSGYFVAHNRGKKSVTVNLKEEKGVEIFYRLLKRCDVLVENFRPGTMKKLGLDYETLRKVKPDLIYAAISGFGQDGPLSHLPAYDIIAQAMCGLMSITGFPDQPPTKVGSSIMDIIAGMFACIGILAALHHRRETGEGQLVDVAMLDSGLAVLENAVPCYTMLGEVPQRNGNAHSSGVPFSAYPAKDGYVVIAVGNENLWKAFAKAIGREDLADHPEYKTGLARRRHAAEVDAIVSAWTSERTCDEVCRILSQARVPVAPVLTLDKILEHPHVKAREMLVDIDDPVLGSVRVPNIPIKFSATPSGPVAGAPLLGQHNEEVFRDLLNCNED